VGPLGQKRFRLRRRVVDRFGTFFVAVDVIFVVVEPLDGVDGIFRRAVANFGAKNRYF